MKENMKSLDILGCVRENWVLSQIRHQQEKASLNSTSMSDSSRRQVQRLKQVIETKQLNVHGRRNACTTSQKQLRQKDILQIKKNEPKKKCKENSLGS